MEDDNAENGGDIDEDEDYDRPNEYKNYLDKDTFQRLKQIDPSITNLYINLCSDDSIQKCIFNSIDWKEDGDCIVNNTHLKQIHITYVATGRSYIYTLGEEGHNLPTKEQLQGFFSCIYRNRSIETIIITSVSIINKFGGGLIEGLCGHPSLTRLEIGHVYDMLRQVQIGKIGCEALGKVLKHPESILKYLRASYTQLNDEGLSALCDGLLGNSRMKRLELGGNSGITPVGWRALSAVLQHPNCTLIKLSLNNTSITDEGAGLLGSALRGSTLKSLNLSDNRLISSSVWQTLFNQLSQPPIESLELSGSEIDDIGLTTLASISTLKSLTLCGIHSITPTGWRYFFDSLQRRGTQLKKLDISGNRIGEICIQALGSLLSSMSTMKCLCMGFGNNTPQGWVSLFTSLLDSNLDLEKLDLDRNNIDDEGIQILVRLISTMTSLKSLCLDENELVSTAGWQGLTEFFQRPDFALEELSLGENNVDDDTLIPMTIALVNNKTLQRLNLEESFDEDTGEYFTLITERGWEALSSLLCNKTSIMDTYNSNHSLNYVYCELCPDDLVSLLKLNKNKDKVEVARQKILQTHLSSGDTSKMQELLDMELEMIPVAISWIGRSTPIGYWKGKNVSGLSTMFNLMRKMPDLFDPSAQKKPSIVAKRKRGIPGIPNCIHKSTGIFLCENER